MLNSIQSFEYVVNLYLLKNILEITNELSQALWRSNQDIMNGMVLVRVLKKRSQIMREVGWHYLLDEISYFFYKYNIVIPNMDNVFFMKGRSRCKIQKVSSLCHFQVEPFYQVILGQFQELNNCFIKVNMKLLFCVWHV